MIRTLLTVATMTLVLSACEKMDSESTTQAIEATKAVASDAYDVTRDVAGDAYDVSKDTAGKAAVYTGEKMQQAGEYLSESGKSIQSPETTGE